MVQVVKDGLRADARRNRARILEAARVEFAASGAETQVDDVAARAGVGVGTIYRHFETKEALLGELVRERFLAFAEQAEEAARGEGRAFDRLAGLLRAAAAAMAADAGARFAVMTGGAAVKARAEDGLRALLERYRPLVEQAQAEGDLRADFDVEEIGPLMCGVCAVMDRWPQATWPRSLEVVLDGLRVNP